MGMLIWGVACVSLALSAVAAEEAIVRYEDFGAKGDGVTDDFAAIVAAHRRANERGLPVRARDGATYYLSGTNLTATIQTDTDFGTAKFIVDDRAVQKINAPIFQIISTLKSFPVKGITTLKAGQERIDATFEDPALVFAENKEKKQYIRFGPNENTGTPQQDLFLVDQEGRVDPLTPIVWDFEKLTSLRAYPIDSRTLTLRGGTFTTVANQNEGRMRYMNRGIRVNRSHVLLQGITHLVEGEGEHGFPYAGFIGVSRSSHVTIRDTIFTGHRTYQVIKPKAKIGMGTYDLNVDRSTHVSMINCRLSNDIMDRTRWGVMGSNFCKNLLLDGCVFSRFDAHQGVVNATIRNCTLGYQGCNAIGFGTLLLENTTAKGYSLVNFRSDYGSTWRGKVIVRNCTFIRGGTGYGNIALFGGQNTGMHDFGYSCTLPETIEIDGLLIQDKKHPKKYSGPAILGNLNRQYRDESYTEKYPYGKPKQVIVKNLRTESGVKWRLSDNPVMFRNVRVIEK